MVLLTLILGCDTESSPAPSAPAADEAPAERPARPMAGGVPEVTVELPELELPPELQAVTVQLIAKENDEARQALDAWLATHPEDANAWYLRGESHMTDLSWAEAEADFAKAVTADPTHADALKRLIGAQIGQRNCEAVLSGIETYQQLRPDDLEPLMMRSFCKSAANDHEGALADLKQACAGGFEEACSVVPRLESRIAWIAKKKAELAEAETEDEKPQ